MGYFDRFMSVPVHRLNFELVTCFVSASRFVTAKLKSWR